MKRLLVLLFSFIAGTAAAAPAAPMNGMWWNSSEGGRGFVIDAQNETLVLAFFGYDDSGRMQWYYADGPLGCGGYCWSGTLLKFDNGQPLNGNFRPNASAGSAGSVSIAFTSRVTGTLTLPGGRSIPIQRFNHSVGNAPQALLGQWAYYYLIGSSWFVDVYSFTKTLAPTTNGNGVVANAANTAGFELQVAGSLAGNIVGFHFSSTGAVLDQYIYQLQLEEGRGAWVSPTTFNQYGMNAYKMFTAAGTAKAEVLVDARDLEGRVRDSRPGKSLAQLTSENAEIGRIATEIWERIRQ